MSDETNYKEYYLINYDTEKAEIDICFPHELAAWQAKGYQSVSYSELYNYREKLVTKNQTRIEKARQKRIRRNGGSRE